MDDEIITSQGTIILPENVEDYLKEKQIKIKPNGNETKIKQNERKIKPIEKINKKKKHKNKSIKERLNIKQ